MEVLNNFTLLAYKGVDFLIPSKYVVAGFYQHIQNDAKNVIYNRETLPHLHIGTLLEKEFACKKKVDTGVVLVLKMQDFASDVCVNISDYTDTAFPASGYMALSVSGEICNVILPCTEMELLPQGIRNRMTACGISAIRFPKEGSKQILLAPDFLIRRFFSGALF